MKVSRKDALLWLRKNYLKLITAVIVLILLLLVFGTSAKIILLGVVLVLLASFSTFYFNYVNAPINFELVKISTILMAYSNGIVAGLIVGVLSTIIGKILIGRIDERLPISVMAISLVAVGAGLFSSAEIVTLGIILVGIYNVALFSLSVAMGRSLGWNLPYEGSNFVLNFILFTRVVPFLLPLF